VATERLYYTDAYRSEFDAQIVERSQVDTRIALILDQTAFYPTSGGQPHDLGTLNGLPVVDVIDRDGTILHVLGDTDLNLAPGDAVHGVIDWTRRLDHMQQHTGQHLISQVFARLFEHETIAVHFGAQESTLDLDAGDLEPAHLAQAEAYANELIYQALPVSAYFVTNDQLAALPLRRPPKVSGQIRIVEIDRWDYSACGGTHCRTTAEIGVIKFLRSERRKGATRLVFQCGRRAYLDYAERHALLSQIALLYSTDARQTPELAARSLAQLNQAQQEIARLTTQLASYEADQLLAQSETHGPYRLIAQAFADRQADSLKALAAHLQTAPGAVIVLAGYDQAKSTVIIARAEDVPLHAGQLLRALLTHFGGSGGGRPEFAQGGGVAPEQLADVIADAAERVREALSSTLPMKQ
jgi:alanyl-tRNA synthetase